MGETKVATRLNVRGVELVPMYQRYQSDSPVIAGELLTRPTGLGSVESYFSSLDVATQFELLDWHLALSDVIADTCAARVAINIDNSMVAHEEDRNVFIDRISRHSNSVIFEFTETHPMPSVEIANLLLRRIRELGHLSALDDFGSGYNGMSLFTEYDFDVVKFDRSLSADIAPGSDELRAMRLLRQMLDELGKRHVVEGVESAEVHELLVDAGFTTFQGHLFHRPVRVDEFLERCGVGS